MIHPRVDCPVLIDKSRTAHESMKGNVSGLWTFIGRAHVTNICPKTKALTNTWSLKKALLTQNRQKIAYYTIKSGFTERRFNSRSFGPDCPVLFDKSRTANENVGGQRPMAFAPNNPLRNHQEVRFFLDRLERHNTHQKFAQKTRNLHPNIKPKILTRSSFGTDCLITSNSWHWEFSIWYRVFQKFRTMR